MAASFVQKAVSGNIGGSSPGTCTFGGNTGAGNAVLLMARSDSALTITADSVNSVAAAAVDSDLTQNPRMYTFIAENIASAASVVGSVTSFGGAGFWWVATVECSGVPTSSVVRNSYKATGTPTGSGPYDCTVTGIAASAGDIVIAVCSQPAFATMSAGADFTLRDGSIAAAGGIQTYVPGSALSGYTAHFTSDVPNVYTMLVTVLKGTGGGAVVLPPSGIQVRQAVHRSNAY